MQTHSLWLSGAVFRKTRSIVRLGYRPNASARSLRTLTTNKLLVTVPDISNRFFSLILQGIEKAALQEGYAVVLGATRHDPQREELYAQMLLRQEADGLIFLGRKPLQHRRRPHRGLAA